MGSCILKVLQKRTDVSFENDAERDEFRVIIPRGAKVSVSEAHQSIKLPRELIAVVLHCEGEMSRRELQETLGLKGRATFSTRYIKPALEAGLLEMKYPDQPTNRHQKYRLTQKGHELKLRLKMNSQKNSTPVQNNLNF